MGVALVRGIHCDACLSTRDVLIVHAVDDVNRSDAVALTRELSPIAHDIDTAYLTAASCPPKVPESPLSEKDVERDK